MNTLEDLELQIMELEERLRPIAQRPVDVAHPGWTGPLRAGVPPLDEAGVRSTAERLLGELIAAYGQGPEETQAAIRRLFTEYRSFAWAAGWSEPGTSVVGFRQQLMLFSMQDQGQDGRDARLALQEICRAAAAAGVDPATVLREVADLSSRADRYSLGSTRDLLLERGPAR